MRRFWRVVWWIGLGSDILSSVILIKNSFDIELVRSLQTVLDVYEQATRFVFGQWVDALFKALGSGTDFRLALAPVWKHVFIVLFVAVSEIVRTRLDHRSHNAPTKYGLLALGAVFAFGCALPWGLAKSNSAVSGYGAALSPLFILLLTDLLVTMSLAEPLKGTLWRFLRMFLLLFVVSLVMVLTSVDKTMAERHDLVPIATLYMIGVVASYAIASGRRVGQAILAPYIGAGVLLLASAAAVNLESG